MKKNIDRQLLAGAGQDANLDSARWALDFAGVHLKVRCGLGVHCEADAPRAIS